MYVQRASRETERRVRERERQADLAHLRGLVQAGEEMQGLNRMAAGRLLSRSVESAGDQSEVAEGIERWQRIWQQTVAQFVAEAELVLNRTSVGDQVQEDFDSDPLHPMTDAGFRDYMRSQLQLAWRDSVENIEQSDDDSNLGTEEGEDGNCYHDNGNDGEEHDDSQYANSESTDSTHSSQLSSGCWCESEYSDSDSDADTGDSDSSSDDDNATESTHSSQSSRIYGGASENSESEDDENPSSLSVNYDSGDEDEEQSIEDIGARVAEWLVFRNETEATGDSILEAVAAFLGHGIDINRSRPAEAIEEYEPLPAYQEQRTHTPNEVDITTREVPEDEENEQEQEQEQETEGFQYIITTDGPAPRLPRNEPTYPQVNVTVTEVEAEPDSPLPQSSRIVVLARAYGVTALDLAAAPIPQFEPLPSTSASSSGAGVRAEAGDYFDPAFAPRAEPESGSGSSSESSSNSHSEFHSESGSESSSGSSSHFESDSDSSSASGPKLHSDSDSDSSSDRDSDASSRAHSPRISQSLADLAVTLSALRSTPDSSNFNTPIWPPIPLLVGRWLDSLHDRGEEIELEVRHVTLPSPPFPLPPPIPQLGYRVGEIASSGQNGDSIQNIPEATAAAQIPLPPSPSPSPPAVAPRSSAREELHIEIEHVEDIDDIEVGESILIEIEHIEDISLLPATSRDRQITPGPVVPPPAQLSRAGEESLVDVEIEHVEDIEDPDTVRLERSDGLVVLGRSPLRSSPGFGAPLTLSPGARVREEMLVEIEHIEDVEDVEDGEVGGAVS